MKILYVIHNFPPWSFGGAEIYAHHIAQAVGARHEVRVFAREPAPKPENYQVRDLVHDGVSVRAVKFTPHPASHPLEAFTSQLSNRRIEKIFEEYLKDFDPDIVHFQHTMGLSPALIGVAKRRGLPVVHTLHDYWYMCRQVQLLTLDRRICSGPGSGMKCRQCLSSRFVRNSALGSLVRWAGGLLYVYRTSRMRRLLCQADLLITPSRFLKQKFVEFGIPEEKIRFSEYGMHTGPFANLRPHQRKRPLRFGLIGTVIPQKGIHIAVEAFRNLDPSEATLDIHGQILEGEMKLYAEDLKSKATENIRFHGAFDHSRIAEVLGDMDVLVVPSVWHETFCIVIREAMMAGVPSIASNLGAIPQVMEDERTGMLFEVGSKDDLLAKVKQILADPAQIDRFRANMPSSFKSIEDNALELEQIYVRMLAKEPA